MRINRVLAAVVVVGLGGAAVAQTATGYVFADSNRNGERDRGEEGIPGVRVSNQLQVTVTDESGLWRLPHDDDTIFFVVKPRGWRTPLSEHNLPRFYYIHKPAGSPEQRYPGIETTGPLPASIDFPLTRHAEPDRFRALVWADPQPRDQREIDYIAHDVIEELKDIKGVAFGVTLGDIMFDDLSLFGSLNAAIALIGIPWYNVIGNHDINYDALVDADSDETFHKHYGPNYYSFDYGNAHFIALDDVEWFIPSAGGGRYRGGLGEDQVEWIKNDLELVPDEKLVVLMMHIPIIDVRDRQDVYQLIEQRPHVVSIAGHEHFQQHVFIDAKDGWRGPQPHHHVINVTVSGSWWSGRPDFRGVPMTTMRDGAPNGYAIYTFADNEYSIEYRAAGYPRASQMHVILPEEVSALLPVEVLANVWGGSTRSVVEARVAGGAWFPLAPVARPDPWYLQAFERSKSVESPYRALVPPMDSPHLWAAPLPVEGLDPGTYLITVRTTDMFGQTYTAYRTVRVV